MKSKILILTPLIPYPLDEGGKISQYAFLEYLQYHMHISLILVANNKQEENYIDVLKVKLPKVNIEYPNKVSAEDHWFTVLLLLQKERIKILIDENLIYCLYSLDGFTTHNNKKTNSFRENRQQLCQFYKTQINL